MSAASVVQASPEGGGKGQRLPGIDALRGIAVLAVLLDHLPFSASLSVAGAGGAKPVSAFPEWLSEGLALGGYGVNLFLVLSGFCIHMRWARQGGASAIDFIPFWKRRLHRLYPPYFVALVLSVGGLFVIHGLLGHAGPEWFRKFGYGSSGLFLLDLALLLTLTQNLTAASQRIGNGPFWSLALEEQLYILYFPLLWLRRRHGWGWTLAVVGVVTLGLRLLGPALPRDLHGFWYVFGPTRWLEWTLGALAVEAHLGLVKVPRWAGSGGVAVIVLAAAVALRTLPGLLGLSRLFFLEDPLFGLAFFITINAVCASGWGFVKPSLATRALVGVGIFSYSLYLTHVPVLAFVKQAAMRAGLGAASVTVLRFVVPIALGYVFFLVIERRFLNQSRDRVAKASDGGDAGAAATEKASAT